jgi:hypothetical protein
MTNKLVTGPFQVNINRSEMKGEPVVRDGSNATNHTFLIEGGIP